MMRKDLVEGLEIKDSKKFDAEGYTSHELLYVLGEALDALYKRGDGLDMALSKLDKDITALAHEIELDDNPTNTEMAQRYKEIKRLYAARRNVKRDRVIQRKIEGYLPDLKNTRLTLLNYISNLGGFQPTYYKEGRLNQMLPAYKQGELKRLMKELEE